MQSESVQLVQTSWQKVTPIAPVAARLFYANLFEADPTLRALFKGDMEQQGQRLMQMIGIAVDKLDDLGSLVPAVQALGRRHAGYGVQDAHYDTVGSALLNTLAQGLGNDFDARTRAAWAEVYGVLSGTMMAAAKT